MKRRLSVVGIILPALLVAGVKPALAQGSPLTINGTVVDAASATPLAGAQLTLTASMALAVFPPSDQSPTLSMARTAISDSLGQYELRGVPAGRYQLQIRRLGYLPSVMDVDLTEGAGAARLSIGLVVVPIRLRAVSVRSNGLNMFGDGSVDGGASAVSPVEAARARQSRFLGTDVRELTATGALEGGSLGETDIFRAMRRMPGVTGQDDELADLWVRGARWDQVRVSYDGMPIFNPFHARGRLSGIGADGIGAAFLHPGVRSVSLLNQGASLIDVRSRPATDTGFRATGELSTLGIAGFAEVGSILGGPTSATLMLRRSLFRKLGDQEMVSGFGSDFKESAWRLDHRLSGGRSIEVSYLHSRDFGSMDSATNGSLVGRVTYSTPAWGLRATHTFGLSNYHSSGRTPRLPPGIVDSTYFPFVGSAPRSAYVHYFTLRGDLAPGDSLAPAAWRAGYDLSMYDAGWYAIRSHMAWSNQLTQPFLTFPTLLLGSLWAERRLTPTDNLTIDAGIRGESDVFHGRSRLAPSMVARYRFSPTTSMSVGASRTFQDVQELPGIADNVPGNGIWLLSGPLVSPIRADQANLGLSRWLGESVLFDANVYARSLHHLAFPALPTGDTLNQPLFIPGTLYGQGIELSLRKLTGRMTGSVGYTFANAAEQIAGTSYAGSGDRPHTFDASALVRLGRFRVGGGLTYMTGAPYTRIFTGKGWATGVNDVHWEQLPHAQLRNGERLPDFLSVDMFAEWNGLLGQRRFTPFIGMRNLTNHRNLTFALLRRDPPMTPSGYRQLELLPSGDVLGSTFYSRQLTAGGRIVF